MENCEQATDKLKWICVECIKDPYLSRKATQGNFSKTCNYCKCTNNVISITDIANDVKRVIDQYYTEKSLFFGIMKVFGDSDNSLSQRFNSEDIVNIIQRIVGIGEIPAEDIRLLLEAKFQYVDSLRKSPYSQNTEYIKDEKSDDDIADLWIEFEKSLVEETRFFNKKARKILRKIFGDIGNQKNFMGKTLVFEAGPECEINSFFRARVFQSTEDLNNAILRPDKELGPPPKVKAKAGRMNPKAISVFYGSNDPEVAISETRPPVGSYVLVGKFNILKNIRILDVSSLDSIYTSFSVFDPKYNEKSKISKFLKRMCTMFSRPILPDDEDISYTVTQSIADYLSSNISPTIDGILFPSSQCGADNFNVVLFHKSSRVKNKNELDKKNIVAHNYFGILKDNDKESFEFMYSLNYDVKNNSIKKDNKNNYYVSSRAFLFHWLFVNSCLSFV